MHEVVTIYLPKGDPFPKQTTAHQETHEFTLHFAHVMNPAILTNGQQFGSPFPFFP